MSVTPLHRLAEMIRAGDYINDQELLDTLGRDSTIVVPMHGGGERLLPSGEILDVLAGGTGKSVPEVLSQSFRMNKAEIDSASAFIQLVQFAGDIPETSTGEEQPFQPLDR